MFSQFFSPERIVVGTAQFGMPYGITNSSGQVSSEDAREILSIAKRSGVAFLDTAAAYGESEAQLGEYLRRGADFKVISKIAAIDADVVADADIQSLYKKILLSLGRLDRGAFDALLVHRVSDVFKPGGARVVDFLKELRCKGITRRIGVSIYEASEIDDILHMFQPDIVQIPLNVFDQRLKRSGHIARLREMGIEVHARSIFLQGVLLASEDRLPSLLKKHQAHFSRYFTFLRENRLSQLRACIGFALNQCNVDRIVVGVTTPEEMKQILAFAGEGSSLPAMDVLASDEMELIDPRQWKRV